MRVFARRERPHPAAQLTLFEAGNGRRYSLWVTNLPAAVRGWRANPAGAAPPTGCTPGSRTGSFAGGDQEARGVFSEVPGGR